MPTTDELQASVDALTARVEAVEAWADAVVPPLRNLVRRFVDAPPRDASGAVVNMAAAVPDGSELADVLAAVPKRTTD